MAAKGGNFDTSEKGAPPPLVTTKFTVRDYGNASPRYIRSTMYYVPATEVITAVPNMSIKQAAEIMRDSKIGCLPVVTSDRKELVGSMYRYRS